MTGANVNTLLVGIDAGCLPVFRRLFDEGRLPALESLCSEGVAAPMESQIPPWTPSAWPSLYTGVNPGKHGVYGFVTYEGYDWRVVTAGDVREFTLWELLDRHDKTSVVVNGPVTAPPPAIDGAVIPGFMGPEDPDCHPSGLLDDVRAEIGEYRIYPAYHTDDDSYTVDEKTSEYADLVRMRGDAFRYLADRYDPDFGFVQFQRPDTVFHEFDGNWDAVRRVYEATDEAIGRVLDECDPDRVFLASDHGMGPYERPQFRVNDFLREEGHVVGTRGGKGMPGWSPIRDKLRHGETTESWEPSLVERAAASAASVGLTADRARSALERVNLADAVSQHLSANVSRTATEQVDFAESTAYLRARTELGVRINLAGREPDGVVSPAEYDAVRADLVEALRSVTAPGGEPVFEEVGPREEYFHGPELEQAVDVVVVPNDFQHFLSDQLAGDPFGERKTRWNHKRDGVFVACGDGIDESAAVDPHLFDVAPTILASMGIEPSTRMDGDVLPVTARVPPRSYPPYEGEADDIEAGVEGRLADLGYLE
ncbi:alkaline phosphatase family protein [Halosimplex salinum]|uniref:alkaline phosphatase family protein n=1 Tax=Halosimplex salinum TaxID=1710538 RepID=UPI001F1BACC0|nr:alkaline phosphatase family protein [Halosimplex salinum]